MKNKILKQNRGITLIALVITIIVLLILAGVAISMLSGENGILRKAASAKTRTDEETTLEQIKLAATAAIMNEDHKVDETMLNQELTRYGYGTASGNETDGYTVTVDNVTYKIASNGTVSKSSNNPGKVTIESLKASGEPVKEDKLTLTDENGHSITIPKNFNIASESPTVVTKGMIIEDSEDNQYVWIPVFTNEQYSWGADYSAVKTQTEDTEAYYTAIQTSLKNYTATYIASNHSDEWYEDKTWGYYEESDTERTNLIKYTNGNMTETEYDTLYHNMLKSVYKNGGFYIGRYEMGIAVVNSATEAENNTRTSMTEYTSTNKNANNSAPSIEGMTLPVSKANAVGYNYITQPQAQMLAEKLKEKGDYINVTSSIMFGIQWDAVCVFIENFDTRNTAPTKSQWLTTSDYGKLWGNYMNSSFELNRGFYNCYKYTQINSATYTYKYTGWDNSLTQISNKYFDKLYLCTTGASNQNNSLNIYDFAGNLHELTLEVFVDEIKPVERGHSFSESTSASEEFGGFFASSRSYVFYLYNYSHSSSSRVSLFII